MPSPRKKPIELQARNLVLAGTSVVAGEGRAVVYATGAHTEFGRIAKLTQGDNRERSPLLAEIARVSRIIGVMATVAGVVLAAIGMKAGLPLWSAFVFGIGIIVANVPEGPAADGDPGARHGRAAHGEAERSDPPPARGRDAGLVHRHLHRQDRDADPQPDGGEGDVRTWPEALGIRRSATARR